MIGTVVAREDTPNSGEFYFVFEGELGKGAFVEYGDPGKTIARVDEVFSTNEYFENTETVSETMKSGESVGDKFPVDEWEVSVARAEIMGKFFDGRIKRVDTAPSPGEKIEEADPGRVEKFLGLDQEGISLGKVQQQEVDADLNLTDTLQKHFAILAQSGAGKSYTASVLLEELMDRESSPAVVAVDPHGDYTCFSRDENYMADTRVFGKGEITVAASNLSADRVATFFPGMSSVQRQELSQVFSRLDRGETSDYSLSDIIARIEEKEMNDKTKYSLLRKLNRLDSMDIFGRSNSPSRNDLEPGKLNILDLSDMIDHQEKQIVAAYFAQRFFALRRNGSIPPFLYLVEEAHNFAPGEKPAPSKGIIEKIAREGRKFHASLGLISQRPVRLSTTALSQCNTKLVMRVTNPNDLEHISQSSEGITSSVKDGIPGLKTGEAIVMGEAVNYPTFIDVRERKSDESETGESLEDAIQDWKEERQREEKDAEAFM